MNQEVRELVDIIINGKNQEVSREIILDKVEAYLLAYLKNISK